MSFFDDVDEPPRTETRSSARASSRSTPRGRRPSGPGGRGPGPRRPAGGQQSIQVRRAIAAAALVIVILLVAIGVHSCQASATENALKDYANSVASIVNSSNATSQELFTNDLLANAGSSNATGVEDAVAQTLVKAQNELDSATGASVPSQMQTANTYLVQALRYRRDGIKQIAANIEQALAGGTASKTPLQNLASGMARFYASDVAYKDYAVPALVSALHGDGIGVGGTNGETIVGGQFLPSLAWLSSAGIASALHITVPGVAPAKLGPGPHGDKIDSVSVGGTTLQSGSTNTVPAKTTAFVVNFTNSGASDEVNTVCKVSITGTGVTGQGVIASTTPGNNYACTATLKTSPPAGTYRVVATVEKVPGETNLTNNSLSYTVEFQ